LQNDQIIMHEIESEKIIIFGYIAINSKEDMNECLWACELLQYFRNSWMKTHDSVSFNYKQKQQQIEIFVICKEKKL